MAKKNNTFQEFLTESIGALGLHQYMTETHISMEDRNKCVIALARICRDQQNQIDALKIEVQVLKGKINEQKTTPGASAGTGSTENEV